MIKVWGRASSSNVQVVLWCLHELDISYERVDAGFTYGVTDTTEYLDMNPNGLVPTLQDGVDPPMFESCAICRHLANSYANESFWPSVASERAQIDMWAEWSKLNVAQNFSLPLFWPTVRLPPDETSRDAIDSALVNLNKFLAIADGRLAKNTYLVSNEFTLADVVFGHSLYRYYDIDIARAEFTHLNRYYQQLKKRKAFQETVMVSYDELRYKA